MDTWPDLAAHRHLAFRSCQRGVRTQAKKWQVTGLTARHGPPPCLRLPAIGLPLGGLTLSATTFPERSPAKADGGPRAEGCVGCSRAC